MRKSFVISLLTSLTFIGLMVVVGKHWSDSPWARKYRLMVPLVGAAAISITTLVVMETFTFLSRFTMLRKFPNEAHDWFMSHPDDWLVLEGDDCAEFVSKAERFRSGGTTKDASRLWGPVAIDIPALPGRTIVVYGRAPRCFDSVRQFAAKMKRQTKART